MGTGCRFFPRGLPALGKRATTRPSRRLIPRSSPNGCRFETDPGTWEVLVLRRAWERHGEAGARPAGSDRLVQAGAGWCDGRTWLQVQAGHGLEIAVCRFATDPRLRLANILLPGGCNCTDGCMTAGPPFHVSKPNSEAEAPSGGVCRLSKWGAAWKLRRADRSYPSSAVVPHPGPP